MNKLVQIRAVVALAALLATIGPAHAQFNLKELKNLIPPLGGSNSQESTGTSGTPNAQAAADAPPVKASAKALSEMAPDVNCTRPRERFNIAEKLTEFGGQAATLRMERVIGSDFRYTDLTPDDKQMLRYVAQTTVWVPAEVENKLGAIYDTTTGLFGLGGAKLSETDQMALEDIEKRLTMLRGVVPEYPAEIHLKLDKKLPDGAFARFGGLILLSDRFLNGLGDAGSGADFLLAHEVSHVYKRHALKSVQFKLISSEEGWGLAKELLARAQRGMQVSPKDAIFAVTTVPELIKFVRGVQVRFNKEQEFEADACSVVWLQAEHVPPKEAWRKYKAILGESGSYAEEHPSGPEREERFNNKVDGVSSAKPKSGSTDKGSVTKEGKALLRNNQKGQTTP